MIPQSVQDKLTCAVPNQQPCERYIIDAGYLRDIMLCLEKAKKS